MNPLIPTSTAPGNLACVPARRRIGCLPFRLELGMFRKLLIANRGEIARRINQVAQRMGIATVAVYSDADAKLPFVREANQAVRIGPPPAKESYLNTAALLEAARSTGADAVHPGYGFLSESADFARDCTDAGLRFVGPPPQSLAKMKDKSRARQIARAAGVPIVPGTSDVVPDAQDAVRQAREIGFPILCKAAAGGGGIGMGVAKDEAELEKVFRQCSDRAISAFGRSGVYLERYFPSPRHIEVQILADTQGTYLHCLERECSIQRRHQKVVEEAPSPLFGPHQSAQQVKPLFDAAIKAARAFEYANAGTAEFLYADGSFYFIEMNARLQVEHPITELTTGVDLIGWQLKIAAAEPLTIKQEQITRTGTALEFRIYAEDPVRFFPSPGLLRVFRPPVGDGIRWDGGYEEGNEVTPYYDPMLGKLIVFGETRGQAISTAVPALESFAVEGVKTNIPLHLRILRSPAFLAGQLSTSFLTALATT
jgi:acetyl-CoA carboxylase, biotin carboxylase subunit